MIRRLWPLGVGFALGFPIFRFCRAYPPPMALLAALAVAAFLYAALRTAGRLYVLFRPPDDPREAAAGNGPDRRGSGVPGGGSVQR